MGDFGSYRCEGSTVWIFPLGSCPLKFFLRFCSHGNGFHSNMSCVPCWKTNPLFRSLSRSISWHPLPFCSIGLFCYDSCRLCAARRAGDLSGREICLVCLSLC